MNRWLRRSSVVFALTLGVAFSPCTSAHAAGVEPAKATPVQREQAQNRFVKGRDLFNAKKYEPALVELNASLDIVASPNTRLYIARCLRQMGKVVAAYVELGRTAIEAKELVRDDPRYEKTGAAAAEERTQLEKQLAFAQLSILRPGPDTVVKVQGDEVRPGGWAEPVPIKPGAATFSVETPGHAPVTKEVTVTAGQRLTVEIDADATPVAAAAPTPAPEPARPTESSPILRPLAFTFAGVAVAGLATFIVAGVMANGTHSDLEAACGAGPCPPGHETDIAAGKSQQTFANIGLGVFAIAGAASVTLFVISAKNAPPNAASARIAARPSFVGLEGRF